MRDSAAPEYMQSPKPSTYSGSLRNLLFGVALLVALFPIPVTAFGLLPTYQQHARFLILYTPIICVLAVGYLFYLRDSLARLLFADLINPHDEDEGYRISTIEEGATRLGRRVRSTVVALLPALLLVASFYCFTGYTRRFSQSLELTSAVMASEGPEPRPYAPADPDGSHSAAARPTIPAPSRADVLRLADLDSIMLFGQLTALYVGIFVAALMAIVVMALKEHAAQAMGLSEHALLLGEWDEEEEPPDEPPDDIPRAAEMAPVASPPVAPPSMAPMDLLAQEVPTARPRRPLPPNGITPPDPVSSPKGPVPSPPVPPPPPPQSPPPPAPPVHRTRYSMEPREPE